MHKLKLLLAALIAILALHPASAQTAASLVGTYQGSIMLTQDKGLRTVLKISKDDHETLKAVFYSIDQSPQPMPVDSITLTGQTLKFSIVPIDLTYEGKVSPDSVTILGASTQGGSARPLNLVRPTAETAWAIPDPPAQIPRMAADAKPVFEVATIKPSDPAVNGKLFRHVGNRASTLNTSLADLIVFAYGIHPRQIVGAPEWVSTQFYDLAGQPDLPGAPSSEQWREMMKALLAERFKLAFHQEKKELSVYVLDLGKMPPGYKKSEDQQGQRSLLYHGHKNGLMLPVRNATLEDFANSMQAAVLDRPVLNHTGLTGRYDFDLLFLPDETMMGGLGITVTPPTDLTDVPPSLFVALQALGFKLEAAKALTPVLVIDHVEQPSAN